jgi:hypothetical protein
MDSCESWSDVPNQPKPTRRDVELGPPGSFDSTDDQSAVQQVRGDASYCLRGDLELSSQVSATDAGATGDVQECGQLRCVDTGASECAL